MEDQRKAGFWRCLIKLWTPGAVTNALPLSAHESHASSQKLPKETAIFPSEMYIHKYMVSGIYISINITIFYPIFFPKSWYFHVSQRSLMCQLHGPHNKMTWTVVSEVEIPQIQQCWWYIHTISHENIESLNTSFISHLYPTIDGKCLHKYSMDTLFISHNRWFINPSEPL